jgi:fibronectin type 3 domain-containing protein
MDDKAPKKVKRLASIDTSDGPFLMWTAPKAKTELDKAVQYVVYRFRKGEPLNLEDPSHIVTITRKSFYRLPLADTPGKYTYVVTAIDRAHNESKPAKKKIKF